MKKNRRRAELSPLAHQVWSRMIDWFRKVSPGEQIPREVELAAKYEVSRTTVRKILDYLESEGLVRRNGSQRVLTRRIRAGDEPPEAPEPVPRDRQVVRYVLEQIGRGEIQPGQRISEKNIATALGFSTGPVREALLTLAPMGIIRKRARRQWEAAALDGGQWEDLMELRTLIELHCLGKLFRGDALNRHRRSLEDQLQRTRRLAEAGAIDVDRFLRLDLAFHQWLLDSCGNKVLIDRHRFIYAIIEFQLRNSGFTEERAQLGCSQHVELLQTLLAGDAEKARKALKEHLDDALVTLKSLGGKA